MDATKWRAVNTCPATVDTAHDVSLCADARSTAATTTTWPTAAATMATGAVDDMKHSLHDAPSDDSFSHASEAKGELDVYEQTAETFVVGEYNVSSCPICLERFTLGNPAVIVHCGHSFHLQCLESWRQRSRQCPVCLQHLADNDGHVMNARDARRRRRGRGALREPRHASAASAHDVHAVCKESVFALTSRDAHVSTDDCVGHLAAGDDAMHEYFVPHELHNRHAVVRLWHWLRQWCTAY